MSTNILKVVTALGRVFEVGEQPYNENGVFANALVTEIDFTMGDPVAGFGAGYAVKLDNGQRVDIENAAEVWSAA